MMAGFETPIILIFLLTVPILYLIYKRFEKKKKKLAMKFSNLGFVKSALGDKKKTRRQSRLFYLTLLTIILMIIGFSGPHIPLDTKKEGVNVVLVIDVSGSMQAKDYDPSRISAAKSSAQVLLESLNPKDHAGIVIFESGATTAAYLSPFKENVITKLGNIKAKDGRTAIGDGLSLGIDMATSIPNKKKVVILLSDGVNNAGVIKPAEAIAFAKSADIQVHTIGMGSNKKVVLGYDWFGNPQYADLDEATLQAIADQTGGTYYRSVDTQTLEEIYKQISQDIERQKEETDISIWFFLSALVTIFLELILRYGGKRIIQ